MAAQIAAAKESGTLDRSTDGWRATGKKLAQDRAHVEHVGSKQMWELGDWLVAGEDEVYRHLNRRKVRELAANITGYSRHTLTMAASVSRKVIPSMRIDGLTWWHHLIVAKLSPPQQGEWLTRAAEEGWSAKTLRQHLNGTTTSRRRSPDRLKSLIMELVQFSRQDIPEPTVAQLQEWWRREISE